MYKEDILPLAIIGGLIFITAVLILLIYTIAINTDYTSEYDKFTECVEQTEDREFCLYIVSNDQ